jgi:FHS family L-fucose permease-like MFS transporter
MPEPAKGSALKFDRAIFRHRHLVNAVVVQLFYVGAQVGIWGITINFIVELLPGTSREVASKEFMAVGTLLFVIGRFLGTWLMNFIKDHRLLMMYGVAAALLCVLAMVGTGKMAVYGILAINFFMSIMFPTIFALGVKDLGEQTKLGSSFIIMAIVGGAIIPPAMGLVADEVGIQASFAIPFLCFLTVVYFGARGHQHRSA